VVVGVLCVVARTGAAEVRDGNLSAAHEIGALYVGDGGWIVVLDPTTLAVRHRARRVTVHVLDGARVPTVVTGLSAVGEGFDETNRVAAARDVGPDSGVSETPAPAEWAAGARRLAPR